MSNATGQVILLNGPMGVGKTVVARALADRIAPALFLDGDHVADFRPFDVYEAEHLDYVEATLLHMLAYHAGQGFQRLVVAWVFETPERLQHFCARLGAGGFTTQSYRLKCSPAAHEARVRSRDRTNLHWELTRHRELAAGLEAAARRGDLGRTLDTTEMSPEEAAEFIAEQLGW